MHGAGEISPADLGRDRLVSGRPESKEGVEGALSAVATTAVELLELGVSVSRGDLHLGTVGRCADGLTRSGPRRAHRRAVQPQPYVASAAGVVVEVEGRRSPLAGD